MANNPKAIENLKPFAKGEDDRRYLEGRPKKLITQMKEIGYTKTQVEETMLSMLSLSRKELEKIDRGDEYTIMERTIAGALLKGHDKNSQQDLAQDGVQMILFSQEDFPANHTHKPESDLAKKMTATSGRKCLEQLERLNQVGLSAKMFMGLLIGIMLNVFSINISSISNLPFNPNNSGAFVRIYLS